MIMVLKKKPKALLYQKTGVIILHNRSYDPPRQDLKSRQNMLSSYSSTWWTFKFVLVSHDVVYL